MGTLFYKYLVSQCSSKPIFLIFNNLGLPEIKDYFDSYKNNADS